MTTHYMRPGELEAELQARLARARAPRVQVKARRGAQPRRRGGRLGLAALVAGLISVLTAGLVLAAEYSLINQGDVAEIDEAIYRAYNPAAASGSGVFDAFVQIGASGEEEGYNTDFRPNQYDEKNAATHNRSYRLSNVPIVFDPTLNTLTREFQLDINQVAGDLLSLDEVEVYLTTNPDITGHPFSTNPADANYADKIYELDKVGDDVAGDNWIRLNYDLAAGSGKRDVLLRIPQANFLGSDLGDGPECTFVGGPPAGSSCNTYVVLYSHFGAEDGLGGSDGFEEWGVELYALASKTGTKFNDVNNNGAWDGGEPGLAGWTIYVDYNGNGAFDLGEPSAVTGANGFYTISAIVPGTYKVREVQQAGWTCTFPATSDAFGCFHEETFVAGQTQANNNFGNFLPDPEITVVKSGDTLSKAGDPTAYSFVITNTGNVLLYKESVIDNVIGDITDNVGLPAGVTNYTSNCGASLAVGASCTITLDFAVPAAPDPLVNTVTVTYDMASALNGTEATDTDGHSVNLFQPSITFDKTGDTLSKVGDSVNYVITLNNTSSADTPNLVCTITDAKLGINKNVTLASGASDTTNASYTVLAGDSDPLLNTASVSCSPTGFPNVLTASDGHSVQLFQPSITFDKTGDTLSKVGDSVSYVITLNNTSSADTPNLVCTITDAKLGINKNVTLASGGSDTTNASYTVLAGDSDPLLNTASVSCSPTGFPNVLTASDGHSVNLFQPSITFDKSGPAFTKVGDQNNYVITLNNTSSADTPDLVCTITDAKLGINKNVTLASGGSDTTNASYTTQAGDPDPLVNTASVSCSPTGFPNVLTGSDSVTSDVLHPAFTVAKDCKTGTEPIPQEGPAVFTVSFANTGDADLVVTADDGIGTFNLAIGATASFDVSMAGPFAGQATVQNTVSGTVVLAATYNLSNSYTFTASGDCRVGSKVEVEKTVNGVVDPTLDLVFELYTGPDGFDSGTLLATDSTLGDADGTLEFGDINLDPLETYTICERNVPAGWMSVWTINGNPVTPYNPDADNTPPEDLGNRCVDFGAGQTIGLTAGGTLVFEVDNQVPQGEARTPGYWKNWNTCTSGNQAATAAKNGGSANGFWLLDDLLPQTIGTLDITTCEDGVAILDSRDLNTGKKRANDAAYTLARALLAAQLNVDAGAAHSAHVDAAIADGNLLLADLGFDGTGEFLGPKSKGADAILRQQALSIAGYLDAYNNNLALPPYPDYYP